MIRAPFAMTQVPSNPEALRIAESQAWHQFIKVCQILRH